MQYEETYYQKMFVIIGMNRYFSNTKLIFYVKILSSYKNTLSLKQLEKFFHYCIEQLLSLHEDSLRSIITFLKPISTLRLMILVYLHDRSDSTDNETASREMPAARVVSIVT